MTFELQFPGGLTSEQFLRDYWQQKPLLIPQALPGFNCELGADDLAGLACENEVEARLIIESGGSRPWEVLHSPLDEDVFTRLPASRWTLLVQDVDKHVTAVARLLDSFHLFPDWRLDDVMVSYAADQGSVGPHTDDYDVFLYQAQGRRRWKIHCQPVTEDDFMPDLELRILSNFIAEEEWLLEPGDMLYLPPNIAHWGVAEGVCMTCSVGFRAPSYYEMVADWANRLIERQAPDGRYRDGALAPQTASAEIRPEVLKTIHQLLSESLQDDEESQRSWFGRFISETKENLQVEQQEIPLTPREFHNRLREHGMIQRSGYSRLLFSRGKQGYDSLFANGEEYLIPSDEGDFLPVITRYRELHYGYLQEWLKMWDYLQLVCQLYNDGHYHFPHE